MSGYTIHAVGESLRMRNWRVRRRLVALILVPTIAAALLGAAWVISSMRAADDYRRVNDLARFCGHIGTLTHELAEERGSTAWFVALDRPASGLEDVRAQMDLVDGAAERVRDSGVLLAEEVSGRTRAEIETVITRLDGLRTLRDQTLRAPMRSDAVITAYTAVITDLLSVYGELGKGSADDVLFGQALTLNALARAKEALSFQRALLTVVLVAGRFEQDRLERFLGAVSAERNERAAFAAEATARERRLFDETVDGPVADRAERLRGLVRLRAASGATLRGLDPAEKDDAKGWYDAAGAVVDTMREVEKRHAQEIVARSRYLGEAERSHALLVAGSVAALLALVLAITVGVVRSLVGPLRRLRREALEVAGERLPAYVQKVRESRDGEVAADVSPIGVPGRDEIGEVARAFDEVHRQAVRLAGDEARLRHTVNAMFVNLSRRSQTLVERQLSLVERLERGERDDQRLADLFRLDHLATRMRRNSENLLVLAGQEVARRWRRPVELMDVIRAALSEVEGYDRVTNLVRTEVAVAGPAVSDVVHLLAELVENAVSFSQAGTRVTVSSTRIGGDGGVMVSVTDQGIGMTPEEIARFNHRLAGPQTADASVARHMGLFVVGRLASRHGIRVQLRPQGSGLTAMVMLPESLLVQPPATALPDDPARPPVALPAGVTALPAGDGPGDAGPFPGYPADVAGVFPGRPVDAAGPFPGDPAGVGGPSFPYGPGSPLPAPVTSAGPGVRTPPMPPWGGAAESAGPSVWSPPVERFRPSGGPGEPPDPFAPLADPFGALPGLYDPADGPDSVDTGPLPRVRVPPAEDDFLPIFAAVESGWFRVAPPAGDHAAGPPSEPGAGTPSRPGTGPSPRPGAAPDGPRAEPRPWSSPGDGGWRAARVANAPVRDGTTAAGLPRRTPGANLVPGSVPQPAQPAQPAHPGPGARPAQPRERDAAPVAAERMRERMSGFQRGVRRARDELTNREE
ncbi:nitrate- and nitrite sensing domain-containing protein [Streptosporangium sp. NPDC050855]|uniref:sensor histidine kinase n=1 Tax=Streptosporangium sp. NPDC050855 TaxID=3366194 RepID=UPI0037915981